MTKPQNDPGFIFFKTLIIFRPRVEFMSRHKICLLCRGLIFRLKVHHLVVISVKDIQDLRLIFLVFLKTFHLFFGQVMSTLKKTFKWLSAPSSKRNKRNLNVFTIHVRNKSKTSDKKKTAEIIKDENCESVFYVSHHIWVWKISEKRREIY